MSTEFYDGQNSEEVLDETIEVSDDFMPKLPKEYREQLEREYAEWKKNERQEFDISDADIKAIIENDLAFVSKMNAPEYTLYRKWCEIKEKYPDKTKGTKINKFMDLEVQYDEVEAVKNNIWLPESPEDFRKLKPNLIKCNENAELNNLWNTLRTFCSTQINNTYIGRNLYFMVVDEVTGKYLGILNSSSDFLDLTPRDNYIGWSREVKTQGRMINHTSIGSSIIPTQPLGYNYVGGKLIALMTISDAVENAWNETYDTPEMPSKLVGMTTTSLYSSYSQYQNLKYWTKRGHSSGSIKFEPSKDTLKKIQQYLMTHHDRKYWEWYLATEPGGMPLKRDFKNRSLAWLYTRLKIDKALTEANHQRGIYFCPFYDNMKEYLRKEITEDQLIRRKDFDNRVESLGEVWKNQYADKRYKSLMEQGKFDISENMYLFYDTMITDSWEETKEKYLSQVGR